MDTSLFDYPLQPERIAQTPAEPRDSARLMLVSRNQRSVSHHVFSELPGLLPRGTRLFRNNAAVFKARLVLHRPTGGKIECLLLHPDLSMDPTGNSWRCLLKPGRKYPPGSTFGEPGLFEAEVLEKQTDGRCLARFKVTVPGGVPVVASRLGETPLPPYIHRNEPKTAPTRVADEKRYQTVYADPLKKIAAAAPTAGLHFTPTTLAALEVSGITTHNLALRVGLDTFRPISEDRIENHVIHREWYEIPPATRAALESAGSPRLAVGTTTLRAIEDYFSKYHAGEFSAQEPWLAEAGIFIYPPRQFAGAEMLLTNFHLPRSTLMCLVSAFLTPGSEDGIAWLKELYAEAAKLDYRFYSYGDAMLII